MEYKLLIADDSAAIRDTIAAIFSNSGLSYELYFACNGIEACDVARKVLPDLILMDLIMPEKDGAQAIEELKNDIKTAHIPIVLITASQSIEDSFKAGADDFITKPFHPFELIKRVELSLNIVEKMNRITSQNLLLEKQKNQLRIKNLLIEQRSTELIEEVRYSQKIQKACLPTDNFIDSLLHEWFIFNRPKNMVSGDFYWLGAKNNKVIVTVADCTGHGVSGAFMTMAGIAFLNEINSRYTINQASDILERLRENIMRLLHQKGHEGEANDGMDLSLCMIDFDRLELQFAGANNPLYLIRDNELTIYKADRIPIGIHLEFDKPFTNNIVQLRRNDMLYIFSDGYADQFGGPENKKFRYKQFRHLLLDIHNYPMLEQKKIISDVFENWIGKETQIDDVMVMGIRI